MAVLIHLKLSTKSEGESVDSAAIFLPLSSCGYDPSPFTPGPFHSFVFATCVQP